MKKQDHSAIYLKNIINNLPDFIFWKDKESRFLGCNVAFAHAAGFDSPNDLIGKTDYDMAWKDKAAEYVKIDQKIMSTGKSQIGFEEEQPQKDGSISTMLVSKVPMLNERH